MGAGVVTTRALRGLLLPDDDHGWLWRDDLSPEPTVSGAPLEAFLPWPPERRLIRNRPFVLLSARFLAALDHETAAAVAPLAAQGARVLIGATHGATRQRSPGKLVVAVPAGLWDRRMALHEGHTFAAVDALRVIGRAERIETADREALHVERLLDRIRRRFLARWEPWTIYRRHWIAAWAQADEALADRYGAESPAFAAAEAACWRALPDDLLLYDEAEIRRWAWATAAGARARHPIDDAAD